MRSFKMTVMLNSLKAEGEAIMIAKTTDGYLFQMEKGIICHGIFNPFVCEYYVDDLFTIVKLEDVESKYTILKWYEDFDSITERYTKGGKK